MNLGKKAYRLTMTLNAKWITRTDETGFIGLLLLQELNQGNRVVSRGRWSSRGRQIVFIL
jgi:hypothetical protein